MLGLPVEPGATLILLVWCLLASQRVDAANPITDCCSSFQSSACLILGTFELPRQCRSH